MLTFREFYGWFCPINRAVTLWLATVMLGLLFLALIAKFLMMRTGLEHRKNSRGITMYELAFLHRYILFEYMFTVFFTLVPYAFLGYFFNQGWTFLLYIACLAVGIRKMLISITTIGQRDGGFLLIKKALEDGHPERIKDSMMWELNIAPCPRSVIRLIEEEFHFEYYIDEEGHWIRDCDDEYVLKKPYEVKSSLDYREKPTIHQFFLS